MQYSEDDEVSEGTLVSLPSCVIQINSPEEFNLETNPSAEAPLWPVLYVSPRLPFV
jgi:hypothetical protein